MNIVQAILYDAIAGGTELVAEDLDFKGTYDASGGTYPVAVKGDYYVISVAGTLPLGAVVANEWIWYNGTTWGKTGALTTGVSMVNLKTGNVTIDADDIDDTATTNKFVEATDISNWNAKLDANVAITGATKTKITYDANGLVTAGADATTADIADSLNKRYVTDAEKVVIGNTSGTNTGDETKATIESKLTGTITSHDHSGVYEPINTNITKAGNTFNGISQLVQTDVSGKLPAIDGSQLTNLPSGEVTTASNVGTGAGQVYKTKTGTDIKLKTIKAGTGVTITNNIDDITIDATGTGGGEANTASNYGTQGAGLYDSKNGVDLRFKSLDNPSGKITLTANNTNHTVELGVNITKSDVGLSNVVNSDTTTTANITDSTNKRFVSDAQKTVIGNTSGTNTGDETNSTIKTKLGASSTSTDGYLSSTDWNIFNGKQNSLGFTAVPNTRTINGNALSADITLALGEANTASNSASGAGEGNIYKTKVSQDLVFKKLKAGTNITLTDGTDDITINASGGSGDMTLAGVQSVTGLKTFDKDKIAMKGTSTGKTVISTANTSSTDYTATLPAKDGTLAMLTDITAIQDLIRYKQSQATVQALTDEATITPNWNNGQMATLTLGGNRTLANPTNLLAGTTMQIKITQDATGSRTLAYGTNYKWATSADKTLSTAANAVDILTLSCFDGTNIYCTLLKAFA